MKTTGKIIVISVLLLLVTATLIAISREKEKDPDSINDPFLDFVVDPGKQEVRLYWKNDEGEIFKSIQNLKNYIEDKNLSLVFAMNGGMFRKDYSPQGLFIENKNTLQELDTADGRGNFYLKPNGVFYITTDNIPMVCETAAFSNNGTVKYATQSGPMLIIDGKIHSAFKEGSTNLNIRNGVGILPDNRVVFAMSKNKINFYDFARHFQSLGCKNALYLDGLVSRMYLPEKKWTQTDGHFGVMIGVTDKSNN